MTEQDLSIMKTLMAKVNALEKTILESNFSEEYIKNREYWIKDLDSRIGGAYLKSAFEDFPDDPVPPEQ